MAVSAAYHKHQLRVGIELVVYSLFLACFTAVTVLPKNDENIQILGGELKDTFGAQNFRLFVGDKSFSGTAFKDIVTVNDFYNYIKGPFAHLVFTSDWYTGEPWTTSGSAGRGMVNGANFVVAKTVRLRQKRVRSNSCSVPKVFRGKGIVPDCIDRYSYASEDKSAGFGPHEEVARRGLVYSDAFKWHDQGYNFVGKLGTVYSPGGFSISFNNVSHATTIAEKMQELRWVDEYTRAVVAEVTLYNANLNLFVLVQMIMELPPSGGALVRSNIRSARLHQYVTTADYTRLGFELVCVAFIVYYVAVEAIRVRANNKKYFEEPWNKVDVLNICLFIIQVAMRLAGQTKVDELDFDPSDGSKFDFDGISFYMSTADAITAFNAFLLWVRLLRYMRESRRLSQLIRTLQNAAIPTLGFLIILFLFLIAFAHAGFILFGMYIQDMRTFGDATASLFRYLFGGMSYSTFRDANIVMGPLFYIVFKVWMSLIVIRLFIAIILEAYKDIFKNEKIEGIDFPPLRALYDEASGFVRRRISKKKGEKVLPSEEGSSGALPTIPIVVDTTVGAGGAASGGMSKAVLDRGSAGKLKETLEERVDVMEQHLDARMNEIEKVFVSTVAPIVETLDLLIREQSGLKPGNG